MSGQEAVRITCSSVGDARQVVERLLLSRIQARDIEVISSEPVHELDDMLAGKSRLPVFVLAGAFLGIVAGSALAAGTALLYPIHTGGMPILALLPIGIVTYEAMMLCAILFTLGGLLLEARLLRRLPRDFIRAVVDPLNDEILIIVRKGQSPVSPRTSHQSPLN